ncbi:MAG: hypothetical protein AB7E79_03620 [Rhodospirillaceae bacterium]
MTEFNFARRKLLARALPLAGLAVLGASRAVSAGQAAICADPNKLDSGQMSIRESLNYVETSKDPTKVCSGCGFFTEPQGNCGNCMIFNGPANMNGHCDSWSMKA